MDQYVFRVEKKTPEHPLTPKVIVEFGCNAKNPKAIIDAVVAFGEMLKIHKTPENVVAYMRHNDGIRCANLLVNELFGK